MSLIERWGVAATDRRLRLRCGSQLSHNLKLSPNERREALLLLLLRFAKGGNGEDVPVLMWASCARNARRSNKKRGGGARIVKAASHKHPHNDLCDERSFGDSFFVLLRPIFLSLRTMRTCIYFLRLPPLPSLYLSFSFSFHIMQHAVSLSPRRSFFIHYALVLRLFAISLSLFFFTIPPASIFLSSMHHRSRFSSARQGIPRGIFFQRGKYAGTRRAQLGSLY